VLCHNLVSTLQQHGSVMRSASTWHVVNGRPSTDSPHQATIPHNTPEYQCLWFQFYRASNFYCMAIAAELSSPSGPTSVADSAAINVTAIVSSRPSKQKPKMHLKILVYNQIIPLKTMMWKMQCKMNST
jgi:hypothetical protein